MISRIKETKTKNKGESLKLNDYKHFFVPDTHKREEHIRSTEIVLHTGYMLLAFCRLYYADFESVSKKSRKKPS